MLTKLRAAMTIEDLGHLLDALSSRGGHASLRRIESATGIGRTTLQAWMAGKRTLGLTRFDGQD